MKINKMILYVIIILLTISCNSKAGLPSYLAYSDNYKHLASKFSDASNNNTNIVIDNIKNQVYIDVYDDEYPGKCVVTDTTPFTTLVLKDNILTVTNIGINKFKITNSGIEGKTTRSADHARWYRYTKDDHKTCIMDTYSRNGNGTLRWYKHQKAILIFNYGIYSNE